MRNFRRFLIPIKKNDVPLHQILRRKQMLGKRFIVLTNENLVRTCTKQKVKTKL